jgi:hypothetical protein
MSESMRKQPLGVLPRPYGSIIANTTSNQALGGGQCQALNTHGQGSSGQESMGTWGACSEWINLQKCKLCRPK